MKSLIESRLEPEFIGAFRNQMSKPFREKHENDLFTPCLFDLTQDPTKKHSDSNVVEGTYHGVILDFDDTELTPEEIHAALGHRMFAYSTYSNVDGNRFRVFLPTTHRTTKQAAQVLRRIAAHKLEALGKKTGIAEVSFTRRRCSSCQPRRRRDPRRPSSWNSRANPSIRWIG